jgi:anti-anti-sigma regulatory factor
MVERFGGKLKILNAPTKVKKSLSLAKLLPIFEIFDEEQEAIASFSAE